MSVGPLETLEDVRQRLGGIPSPLSAPPRFGSQPPSVSAPEFNLATCVHVRDGVVDATHQRLEEPLLADRARKLLGPDSLTGTSRW